MPASQYIDETPRLWGVRRGGGLYRHCGRGNAMRPSHLSASLQNSTFRSIIDVANLFVLPAACPRGGPRVSYVRGHSRYATAKVLPCDSLCLWRVPMPTIVEQGQLSQETAGYVDNCLDDRHIGASLRAAKCSLQQKQIGHATVPKVGYA
ncbi:hypothetical protein C8034_v004496 [Colletotrichum sidae]|uniref:Uncharacterized protein n=1 Tax=Colletotrichum sidae TaxID=1347389 RepID=A0A4R8T9X0_9PEZI|nr:hypothetical protein C8034_v004496 [Colletotrichum sidae]